MNVKYLNVVLDYSKFITNNKLTILDTPTLGTQIDLKDLAIEKYKDLTDIIIKYCTVLNQDIEFSIFRKLERLDCSYNRLISLPDLANCRQLEKLDCYNNQLTKLPDLSKCSQLEMLSCGNNQLATLTDLSNCSQLEYLYCDNNQLTTLPDLNKCSKLKELYCDNNQLTTCKSFYSVYNYNFDILNNPIPQIEIDFVENVKSINDYYFNLFNYCVENDILFEEFKKIDFPEDFYDNYILKVTTPTQKKYIGYLTHSKDFNNSIEDLFSFDLKTNI